MKLARKSLFASALAVLLFLTGGCAGYRLGPTNGTQAGARSIEIFPFENQTLEPRLSSDVTSALRKEIQRDATYRLATQGSGDVIVKGTLIRYDREAVTFDPRDTLTARDSIVYLTAHVKAVETGTGKVLLDEPIRGRTTIRIGNDLASAERQALPLLADNLAYIIAGRLVDGEW